MKPLNAGEKASERRAKKAENAAKGKLGRMFPANGEGSADWGSASGEAVKDLIVAMQSIGGAVTFGLSRDGGAYMLTLLLDGERKTDWLSQSEEVDAWIENWVYTIRTVSDD